MEMIHISVAGPMYRLVADKTYRFEDHRFCGPVVLGKDEDPLDAQPGERSLFWQHVNAWYQQGKKYKTINGERWCIYETQMQAARRMTRPADANVKHEGIKECHDEPNR